jgi:hypothetical protein
MLEGGWNLGGYGYFDRRKSESGEYYNQVTFGGEALGRDWDLRANAYLPTGDKVRELGTTTAGGASTAAIVGTTVQVTTGGTTTTTLEERALRGYDAEVGWRVPLFGADEPRQLRVYAGGYRFKDDVTKVSGPRVRAELTLAEVPWLWRGAQFIGSAEAQDDNARGGQTYLSLRLRVPLGGNPERSRSMSFQERRMTAPVMRDVDIVTQARSTVSATTPASVETASALDGGQAFTVLSSATTTGAALPGAVTAAAADSTIILSGTFNTTASIELAGNKSLMAGGISVRTPSGRTAVLTTSATIVGDTTAMNVNAMILTPGNNTVSGLTLMGSGAIARGIVVNTTAGNVVISNNTISLTQTGAGGLVGVTLGQNANVTVADNTFTLRGIAGATLTGIGTSNTSNLTIARNTLDVTGGAANRMISFGADTISAGSTGNVRVNGICTGAPASGSVSFTDGTTCP